MQNKETVWVQTYTNAQSKQFVFSNGMAVCEGNDSWSPKYTIKHYADNAETLQEFMSAVDESIAYKLSFNSTAADKANLIRYWSMHTADFVNEALSEDVKIDKSKLAIRPTIAAGCYVFESMLKSDIEKVIDSIANYSTALSSIVRHTITDENATYSIALPVKYFN